MERTRIMPKNHWDWSMPVPFSQGWKVGNFIFVGGQIPIDEDGKVIGPGDIEKQTRAVFEYIRSVLNEVGADMKDIVKFNTFYRFDGEDQEVIESWEKMTEVRMEFLKNPGPVGTAIRVEGFGHPDILLEVEAIAMVDEK